MFANHVQHTKNVQTSIFPYRNQANLIRPEQGYHNIDSPLKAALRLQTSPLRNLSPLRYQTQTDSKLNNRRSRSPIIFSKRDGMSPGNTRVSPLRKVFEHQQNYGPQKHISFTNLIRRNSNTGNYESQNPQQFNRTTLQHSTKNYLQSDRNFQQDTNLFKKLVHMIKSNKSNNESSFMKSGISDNSIKCKGMPQSCRNQYNNSNKKIFIKNVMTVESIQSPEEKDYGEYEGQYENMETRCYQEYERMTEGCRKERKGQVNWGKEKREGRKEVSNGKGQLREFQALSFKKSSYGNDNKLPNQPQHPSPKITKVDFHLTNSFGTTLNLKNQIIGHQSPNTKPPVNPFQQISQQLQPIESINRSVNESQDSMFASLQMLLSKVNGNHKIEERLERENDSINVSIVEEGSQLDMEPFL